MEAKLMNKKQTLDIKTAENLVCNIRILMEDIMKKFLSILMFFIVCSLHLVAAPYTLTKELSDDQMMLLIKEELEFTNELLQTQQITSQIITLKQKRLQQKTEDILRDFARLKSLANQDEKLDEAKLKQARTELDSLRLATAGISGQIDEFLAEMQAANDKRISNQRRLITLAQNIVRIVEKETDAKLPPNILPTMQKSLQNMKDSIDSELFDHKSYDTFLSAFAQFIAWQERIPKDTALLKIYAEQLRLIGINIQEYNKQYTSFKNAMQEYQRLLSAQEEANRELNKELDRMHAYQQQRVFKEFIYFDTGSISLKSSFLDALKLFATEYKDQAGYEFHIIGYSDTDPIRGKLAKTYPSNWELSLARATVVAKYLINNMQINPNQIVIIGRGEYRPYFSDGIMDKSKSRRVEIRIVKL